MILRILDTGVQKHYIQDRHAAEGGREETLSCFGERAGQWVLGSELQPCALVAWR